MRRIRKPKVKAKHNKENKLFNSKDAMIKAIIAVIIVLILIIVMMLVEKNDGKFTVKNNTDLKLEYVNSYFSGSGEDNSTDFKAFDTIEANKSKSIAITDPLYFLNTEAEIIIKFKYENYEETTINAGYFNNTFSGGIKLSFNPTDDADLIKVKVVVKNGLLADSQVDCNEEYDVRLSDGYVFE
jgi:hypothetical protein